MTLNSFQNSFSNFQTIFEVFIHNVMFITLSLLLFVLLD